MIARIRVEREADYPDRSYTAHIRTIRAGRLVRMDKANARFAHGDGQYPSMPRGSLG
jgi:hypothetical protein